MSPRARGSGNAGASVTLLVFLCACKRSHGAHDAVSAPPDATALVHEAVTAPPATALVREGGLPTPICTALSASESQTTAPPSWKGAPCATIAAAHAALVERVMVGADGGADAASFAKMLVDEFVCAPTSSGAWAVTFDTLAIDHTATDLGVTGKRVLGFYDLAGKRLSAITPTRPEDRKSRDAMTMLDNVSEARFERETRVELATFDWSGDGRSEAFLRLTTKIEEGGTWPRASIWSYDGHAVIEYPPVKGVVASRAFDVDADGRPDLVTTPFAEVHTNPGVYNPELLEGPHFVAHARSDGTFASNDEVAKDAARCTCPTPPTTFVMPSEIRDAVTAVACARVWSRDTATLLAALHTTCIDDASTQSTCVDASVIERLAARPSPVSLP